MPSSSQRAFECGSSEIEDSDNEEGTVESAWRGDGDSDAESVDSDMDDPLKYVQLDSI